MTGLRGKIVRNTSWMAGGLVVKLLAQLGSFALIAPALGADGFGLYVGLLALSNIIGPFVDMGTYGLVVRDISSGRDVRETVADNVALTLVLAAPGLIVFAVASALLLPDVPIWITLVTALGTLIGNKFYNVTRATLVAHEMSSRNALLEVLLAVLQLVAAGLLVALQGDIRLWVALLMVQNLLIGFGGLTWLARLFGRMPWRWRPSALRSRMRDGVHFAVAGSAASMGGQLDTALLPRLAGLEAAGIYGAAQRLILVAAVPISALSAAIYPRYFSLGEQGGYRAARRLALKISVPILLYGLCAGAALWLLAPWLATIVGASFDGVDDAVRILAALVVIQALQLPFGDALTGSGLQEIRTRAQVAGLCLGVVLNLLLIPQLGWLGAAYAALSSQTMYLLLLGVLPQFSRKAIPRTIS